MRFAVVVALAACVPDEGPGPGTCVPLTEDCSTLDIDEDCDGVPTCSGDTAWHTVIGGPDHQLAGAAALAQNRLVVAGNFSGETRIGQSKLVARDFDIYLGEVAITDGTPIGGTSFGNGRYTLATGLAIPPNGDRVLSFTFENTFDVGVTTLASKGDQDVAFFGLTDDGATRFAHGFGDAAKQHSGGVTVGRDGDLLLDGYAVSGTMDFGTGPLAVDAKSCGNYLARFDSKGTLRWAKLFSGANNDWGMSARFMPNDDIVLAGSAHGAIDLGDGIIDGGADSDIVIARLDGNGHHLWSRRLGDAMDQRATLTATESGDLIITGTAMGVIDWGNAITGPAPHNFVARLTASGQTLWVRSFPGELTFGATVDAADQIVLSGYFESAVDVGCGAMTSAGDADAMIAKLSPLGDCIWSRRFGDASAQWGSSRVAIDVTGAMYFPISVAGTIDTGRGVHAADMFDTVVIKLGP